MLLENLLQHKPRLVPSLLLRIEGVDLVFTELLYAFRSLDLFFLLLHLLYFFFNLLHHFDDALAIRVRDLKLQLALEDDVEAFFGRIAKAAVLADHFTRLDLGVDGMLGQHLNLSV